MHQSVKTIQILCVKNSVGSRDSEFQMRALKKGGICTEK